MPSKNDLRFNSRFWEDTPREPETDAPMCEWPGCGEAGLFKAPQSRDHLRKYKYFCLDHVRAYNKSWNYYEGMNTADIERDMKKDTTWDRPSWNFGTFKKRPGQSGGGFKDDFGFFNEDGSFKGEPEDEGDQFDSNERKALAELNLKPGVTYKELRARYRELVKKYHPDTNNGDKEAEERFKVINEAYSLLKNVIV